MSHYNPDVKALYIHVPKTAGTSMEQMPWLRGTGGHIPAKKYMYMPWFEETFKFAFVRNPWDRFVSAYFHTAIPTGETIVDQPHTKAGFAHFVRSLDIEKLTNEKMIEHIWQTYPSIHPWPLHHHFLPQWFFTHDAADGVTQYRSCLVDFVGRYEDLALDWKRVVGSLGMGITELGHSRTAPPYKKHYTHYYTPELWDIVGKIYRADCAHFGYWNVL